MITISKQSKETISQLIRKEFDANAQFWLVERAREMIKIAKEFNLNELAREMESDMDVHKSSFLS